MGRSIAAFYSPDDDLEHAIQVIEPTFGLNSGFPLRDVTFSPATQGHAGPGLPYTPKNTLRMVGALYCPVDQYRHIFYATGDNAVYWYRFSSHYHNPPPDPILQQNGSAPLVNPLVGYPQDGIADIAAFYSAVDGKVHVLVLMHNGDLWRISGMPWQMDPGWQLTPFATKLPGGRRICAFDGAGWGHAIIATDHDVIEVYFIPTKWGQDTIWTFQKAIVDVSAFYTYEDGVAHIIVAMAADAAFTQSDLYEITFTPAQVPPALRQLGTVNFAIDSIGAYEKPDLGRHVIMLRAESGAPPIELFLSWYYSGSGFAYGPWPQLLSW